MTLFWILLSQLSILLIQCTTNQFENLPNDILENIHTRLAPQSRTHFLQTNIALRKISRTFDKDLLKYCGGGRYLDMTLNGFGIFSDTFKKTGLINQAYIAEELEKNIRCTMKIVEGYDALKPFSEFLILLPIEQELVTESSIYLQSITNLFSKIGRLVKVTVVIRKSIRGSDRLHPAVESKLLNLLRNTEINNLYLGIDIQNQENFKRFAVSSTVKKISCYSHLHRNLPLFKHLKSISFMPYYSARGTTLNATERSSMISSISGFEFVEISTDDAPLLLSSNKNLKEISLHGYKINNFKPSLEKLFASRNAFEGLKIGSNYGLDIGLMSQILKSRKKELKWLDISILGTKEWHDIFLNFVIGNAVLKRLNIAVTSQDSKDCLDLSFLEHATGLESLSYSGLLGQKNTFRPLLQFLTNANTSSGLKSISLTHLDSYYIPHHALHSDSFLGFYELLSKAVLMKPMLKDIELNFNLRHDEKFPEFAKKISSISEKLVGRGIRLNSIPIENIVDDLACNTTHVWNEIIGTQKLLKIGHQLLL